MENAMNEEHRREHRAEPEAVVTVEDQVGGGPLGELVNITADGLMLLTDSEVETGSLFQMKLYGTTFDGTTIEFNVGAECVWSRNAGSPDRFWSGYHIIDASEEANDAIVKLLDHYSAT